MQIDNLTEQLKDRDNQASSLRERISALQADQTSSDTAVSSLEDALIEKDQTIQKLRGEQDQGVRDKQETVERLSKQCEELKMQCEELQKSVVEKEVSISVNINYTNCPPKITIGLSASISFEILNWSENALGL